MLALPVVLAAAIATAPSPLTAAAVVARWRTAVHARPAAAETTAVLAGTSSEDGIVGQVEEWVTAAGEYHRRVTRPLDRDEVLVTPRLAVRRDWNGFLRRLEDTALARTRSAVFELQALAFGPPAALAQAALVERSDPDSHVLRFTPPGGVPMTWWLSAKTGLPERCERPGNDTEITTVYEDWRPLAGVLIPERLRVSETEKPDYVRDLTRLQFAPRPPAGAFAPLVAGPSDVHRDASVPPIPFTLESNHVVFDVAVNGRPPMPFILDTGADQEVINETRLADLGLSVYATSATTGGGNAAPYSYAAGATLRLPGVELRDQHVAVIDETGLEHALGIPFGGILGYDFISRFVVEIDYEKALITLHDPEQWTYAGPGVILPVTFDEGIPFTRGAIHVKGRDVPARFVLDSGAQETATLTSPFVKANDLATLAGTNPTVNRPAGMEKEFFAQTNVRGRLDELRLGDLAVSSIPVNMSLNTGGAYASRSFSGTVGEGIFTRYHVFLDYARARVILEPTARAQEAFPERRTYGLSLLASGGDLRTFTVTAVRPGSPAEQDGLLKGDVIAACDGEIAARLTLGRLRDLLSREGERRRLEIRRGEQLLTREIDVRLVSIDR